MSLGPAVIVNAYAYRNAGDAAIMLSTAELMRDLGATSVGISSRYSDAAAYQDFGIEVLPEFIPFAERAPGTSAAVRAAKAIAWLVLACVVIALNDASRRLARVVGGALFPRVRNLPHQTLVIAGGGYMYSSKRRMNLSLWHSLVTVRFAQVFIPKTVMMPQSIGPITGRFDATLVRWALRSTSVVVRETTSLEQSSHAPSIGRVRVVNDVAFYGFGSRVRPVAAIDSDVVRIVVMDWTWSTSVTAAAFENYVREVATVADALTAEGFRVVLGGHSSIPEHGQDDIDVARRIAGKTTHTIEVDSNCDVGHLLEVYAQTKLVIGTRLHACIMALSVGTPAIALAYQQKTLGVYGRIGLGDYAYKVDSLTAQDILARAHTFMALAPESWPMSPGDLAGSVRLEYETELGR